MSILFTPATINNLSIKNRFVRSATYDGSAEPDGHVSDYQVALYTGLAKGGVGLIVTAIAYVDPSGQMSPVMNSVADDETIAGFSKLTKVAHQYDVKIFLQLFHGGREAWWLRSRDQLPVAPSVLDGDPFYQGVHREITEEEIEGVITAFGDSARRAREAEFDGVEVHGAHSYLLSQFLSPFTNRRQDRWGGNLENRLRLHKEVYRSIRKQVGDQYPVIIKLGLQDGFPGGLEIAEGVEAAKVLAQLGFDAIEVSLGLRGEKYQGTEYRTGITRLEKEAYFRDWCRRVAGEVTIPVIAVGGLRTFRLMESLVQNREADLISLCRPLIREPGIVAEWQNNQDKKPKCVSCNKCVEALFELEPLRCRVEKPAPTAP